MRTAPALLLSLALSTGAAVAQTPCAPPGCADLGGFTATVQGLTVSDRPFEARSRIRGLRGSVRLHNTGGEPLILAYKPGTLRAVDDMGADYKRTTPNSMQGIGLVQKDQADPQFRLAPGASRDIRFEIERRYMTDTRQQAMGGVFTLDLTLVELKLLPYQRVETVREHAVAFSELQGRTPLPGGKGTAPASLDKLSKAFRKLGI